MSPLARRLPRDLRHNIGKYLGIFAMLVMAIMFTSGFLMSAASIDDLAQAMREDYHIEDLYFVTMYEATDESIAAAEDLGATVYENFSRDVELATPDAPDRDMTVRLYKNRDGSFDGAAYSEGRAPKKSGEVALDRVFCANHELALGDTVQIAGEDFELVGICTLADYQATYKNAGDFMFNATTFTVAQLTDEDWDRLVGEGATYRYSVILDDRNMDLAARLDFEEELVDVVNDHDSTITDLVDRESNIGLTFAADDVKDDSRMWTILMMVLIVIMAFVFVVLTDATIEQESAVIGTLLANGYRKRELIAHYMVLPTIIGLLGCALGFVLGQTLMAAPMQGLYYNSYSFPPFVAEWHTNVFLLTTAAPFALLVAITFLGLVRKLGATPLQFLRGEASAKARRGGAKLPDRLRFVTRFRLRVFLRNLSHFVTLFFGMMFGSLLLLMGLVLLPVVSDNADLMADSVPANHLYTLKSPLKLDGTQAERKAWAAAFELTTNPDYDALDLELFGTLSDQLDAAGVDMSELSDKLDTEDSALASASGEAASSESSSPESFQLPKQIEDAVEDSVTNRDWKPSDPEVLATWKQVMAAAGIDFKGTDDQLAGIIGTLDTLHVQLHSMDEDAMDEAWKLMGDLLDAASDDSVSLDNLEDQDPVNQTAIDSPTLDQVEKFAVITLEVPRRIGDKREKVTVYGIEPDSRYWTYADVSGHKVLAGEGLLAKCDVELGTEFEAVDRSENTSYRLTLDEACSNGTDMNVYMDIDDFNRLFGKDADNYNGYASDLELALDERYVASDLTPDKMRSMADQMQDSMGSLMNMIVLLVLPLYFVLIYLLTKTVIDRSARAISYMKVFGYRDREIEKLYLRTITCTVVVSLVANVPILVEMFRALLTFMMAGYSGNFVIELPLPLMAREVALGFATYLVVAFLHVLAIRRVSLALAMKVQE